MHKALLWKEWRQLALVRWGGIALGAILPVAFTAGAELAQRGLLPTGRVKAYAPRDLMYELLPMTLVLALWPLIALMSAAQSFAGDRAGGTEAFLLERPVPRQAVWRARLFASLLTLALVMATTAAIAAAAAAITGLPPASGWARWQVIVLLGTGVPLLAYFGAMIAASLLAAPMGAVLLGAVMATLPALLLVQLATAFPYARIGDVLLGVVLPVFLLPAFVAGSWVGFCRGEPAGRGRIGRAATILGGTFAGILIAFVVLAPVFTRVNAGMGQHSVFPSGTGKSLFVGSINNTAWGGGWLVDGTTGAKRAFVPPPFQEAAFSPDESEVAVMTWAGPLGSVRSNERIDIRSTRDGKLLRSFPTSGDDAIVALTWADDGLVAIVVRGSTRETQQAEVEILDPASGARHPTGYRSMGWALRVVGPTADRRVFIRELDMEPERDPKLVPANHQRGYLLHPLDVAAGKVGPAMTDPNGRVLTFAGWTGGLSPSGRFARVIGGPADGGASSILDLADGSRRMPATIPSWARWISGDRLAWCDDLEHRTRLFVAGPGEPPKAIREWRDAQVGVEPSQDGRTLFVSVIPAGGAPPVDGQRPRPEAALFGESVPVGGNPEEFVYFVDEARVVTLGPAFSDRPNDLRYTQWAGPKTLARIAPGVVALEDVDQPGKRRFVIGAPRDLE